MCKELEWNKLSSARSVTADDANAFSKELLGFDINSAVEAYKKSVEGDATDLNTLIDQAAQVNGTTPEHINELMTTMFIK